VKRKTMDKGYIGGDNIGGDKVGGDKTGGDKVGGNKSGNREVFGQTHNEYSGNFQNVSIASTQKGSITQTMVAEPTSEPNLGKGLKEGESGKTTKDKLPEYERLINDKLVSVSFLLKGAIIQDCVCKIVTRYGSATGFLVAKDILMTNHHVFPDVNHAREAKAIFGFNDPHDSTSIKTVLVKEFIYANSELDFALVTITEQMPKFIVLPSDQLEYAPKQHANIIEHPGGNAKMISLRSNEITEVYTNAIEYTSDTEPGSSGSPVFDNDWDLIALHSRAGKQDTNGKWISNKGFRIDQIVVHIKQHENLRKCLGL